jgi:hypothetical protein
VRRAVAVSALLLSAWAPRTSLALDLPKVGKKPIQLDVTEVSIVGQRFQPRTSYGQARSDGGWGFWINRLNAALHWSDWTLGTRLDSALYWNRPTCAENGELPAITGSQCTNLAVDATSRFRDSIYPAKVFLTYARPGIEITAGDAYAQFGRGLILSMRKIDDLGIDNTVRGIKATFSKDPVGATFIAGFPNPSRVDEPSGRALFVPQETKDPTQPGYNARGPQPVFGADRLIGGEIQGGRGGPIVLTTDYVHLQRCAPYEYDFNTGRVKDGNIFTESVGFCDDANVNTWMSTLPTGLGPVIRSRYVDNFGFSAEIPKLGKFGNLYVGFASQRRLLDDRTSDDPTTKYNNQGNAVYATYSGTVGPVTNTVEVKSYRNFYPLAAATLPAEFNNVGYTAPPTAEVITQDSAFGFFNACVDGGRLRSDFRITRGFLLWVQGIYAHTKSELLAECTGAGQVIASSGKERAALQNNVFDVSTGIQWQFDRDRSYVYTTIGSRSDVRENGEPYYRESQVRYTVSKYLGGALSVEAIGLHRVRWEESQNLQGPGVTPAPWVEGENYLALKAAPKWLFRHQGLVFSQGLEYTTRLGYGPGPGEVGWYLNGGLTWRFTQESNVKILVGQQRGGLRCVNGVCRQFPAFEGARMELTIRF